MTEEGALLPATASRVENATSEDLNRHVAGGIEESLRHHAAHPEQIDHRLDELDCEWDIARTLALTGTLLGAFVDRRFLALPAVTGVSSPASPWRDHGP